MNAQLSNQLLTIMPIDLPGQQAVDAVQQGSAQVGQALVDASQHAAPVAQQIFDAGQSLPIGADVAAQIFNQVDAISQSAAMSATQALHFLQGVLY